MPALLIPIAIFLSGLLASAIVRILAGAGITWVFVKGADTLLTNIFSNVDLTGMPAWSIEHAARIGVFEIMGILFGAMVFAFTLRQFNFLTRAFPS